MTDEDAQAFEGFKPVAEEEAAQPQEAEVPSSEDTETVTLVLAGPAGTTGFVGNHEDETFEFTPEGSEAPADLADHFIEQAALSGVLLTRKEN